MDREYFDYTAVGLVADGQAFWVKRTTFKVDEAGTTTVTQAYAPPIDDIIGNLAAYAYEHGARVGDTATVTVRYDREQGWHEIVPDTFKIEHG